jgi:pyridinium-3,5-bisthiocarboxylic acid mononucleotide nickel chelatase
VKRRTLDREMVSVDTVYGPIHLKVARLKGRILTATPEYEDCRTLAAELGIPLKQVLAEAMYQFQKANGVPEVLNEAQKEVQKEIQK